MIENKKKLVAVSALALKAAAIANPVFGQVLITCPNKFLRFGNLATFCNGSYTVTPKGATSTNGTCAQISVKGMPASCVISTGGTPPKKEC